MKKNKTVKINIILVIVLILLFCAAIVKLAYVVISPTVDGIDIEAFANNRNTVKKTLYATRGTIYDTNGEELAASVNSYTVIAYLSASRTTDSTNPQHVVDKETTAKKLSEVFLANGKETMTYEYVLNLLNTPDVYQIELGPGGRGISELVKSAIEDLKLPGIAFISSTKRFYKMASLAPYIIGYAKKNDDGKIVGEMGVESYYNDTLTGTDGQTEYQIDNYGYKLPNSPENTTPAESGDDIYLTIDSNIQLFLEQSLSELTANYQMSWLTFTVADAKSGAILASASNPTFNLNELNITNYLNPLTSYQYEPGSTMKIYSFMAAMENKVYNGSDTYQSGTIQVDDATIKDFNGVGWGTITYDEGFAYSSNVAATKLGLSLGRDRLKEFYEKLGFGAKTNITLPGELSGDIDFNYKTEVATASFGQGITTTPIQNIQALTTIANNGTELQPYIISKIVDHDTGKVKYEASRTELQNVASSETISKLQSLMYDVVYSNKTDAKYYKPTTVNMLGKTGTAQIANPNGSGYLTGTYDYIRSFAGLFPAEDPQYIVYISVKQFQGPISKIANVVTSVVDKIAKYKNIVTINNITNNQSIYLESYVNYSTIDTEEKLKKLKLNVIVIGNGEHIINQYPLATTKIVAGNKVFLLTDGEKYLMPNVMGWSYNDIVTFCRFVNLKYNITGTGKVVGSSIAANTAIDSTMTIDLNLSE